MQIKRVSTLMTSVALVSLSGCGAPPVPVSECGNVVKHIRQVLKDKAPSSSEMNKQCKAATDEQRGCVVAADKPMKLLQCMKCLHILNYLGVPCSLLQVDSSPFGFAI